MADRKHTHPLRPEKYRVVRYLRTVGIVAEASGWGGLMLTDHFWAAVSTIYLGIALGIVDVWYEPDFRKSWKIRLSFSLLGGVFAFLFTLGFVAVPAPLPIGAIMTDANFPIGATVAGMSWRPEFTKLMVDIDNPSDRAYEDLDLVIRPTDAVARIGQDGSVPDVTFEDASPTDATVMVGNTAAGTKNVVPLDLLATDGGYRVRCPHLTANTHLKIVLALADIKWNPTGTPGVPPPGMQIGDEPAMKDYILRLRGDDFSSHWMGHSDGDVYATRPTSSAWVKIDGKYTVAHRQRKITQKVLIGGKFQMPNPPILTPQ